MVDLIPKKQRKPVFSQVFFLLISSAVAIGIGVIFMVLEQVRASENLVVENLSKTLLEDTRPLEMDTEEALQEYKKEIEGVADALKERKDFLAFFALLEQSTHPDIVFTGMEEALGSIVLMGEAENFAILEQQRQVWRTMGQFESVSIADMEITREGNAGFEVTFVLRPDVLGR